VTEVNRYAMSTAISAAGPPSIRELLHIVPTFVAPARTWAEKVTLLTRSIPDDSQPLLEVILSRLPDPIFTQVANSAYKSRSSLLERIVQLESGSPAHLASNFFNAKPTLPHGQKPSFLFHELLATAKQLFPTSSNDIVQEMAKMKLLATLPPSTQSLIALLPKTTSIADILSTLDNSVCEPLTPNLAAAAQWQEPGTLEDGGLSNLHERIRLLEIQPVNVSSGDTTTVMDSLIARISALEARAKRPYQPPPSTHWTTRQQGSHQQFVARNASNPSTFCYYHQKFGSQARQCREPCSWSLHSKNG
jgi:hypothetical protein